MVSSRVCVYCGLLSQKIQVALSPRTKNRDPVSAFGPLFRAHLFCCAAAKLSALPAIDESKTQNRLSQLIFTQTTHGTKQISNRLNFGGGFKLNGKKEIPLNKIMHNAQHDAIHMTGPHGNHASELRMIT